MDQTEEIKINKVIVFYKFLLGVVEMSLGISAAVFGGRIITFYRQYRLHELLEDPHDRLIAAIQHISPFLLAHRTYFITFLLLLGTTKVVGAIALWRGHDWGLDLIVGLFVILVPWDVIELVAQPNAVQLVYFFINLLITFYLVEFKPHVYVKQLLRRLRR